VKTLALLLALTQQQPLVESIEVRVVNVDVVVTDKSGKPVSGLTANDFVILEDGKAQPITNFYEVRSGEGKTTTETTTAVEQKPRRFVLFVDNYSLHPDVRNDVVASLDRFVDKTLEPRDEASIVSWNRSLKILTPFTSDKAVLHDALAKVTKIGSVTSVSSPLARVQAHCAKNVDAVKSARMAVMVAYDDCILAAREETEELALSSRQLMGAINTTLNTLAGFEGRKVLVLAGAELPVKPGQEIYQWANHLFMPYMKGFDAPIEQPKDVGTVQTLAIETVGQTANAQGVTLYLIAAALPGEPNSVAYSSATSDNGADFLHRQNTASAYNTLADLTGGLSVTRTSKLDIMFDAIARDLDAYYSLGYKPNDYAGSTPRAIAVQTKDRSLTVRARKTWTAKTADEQFADRVVSNIYAPGMKSDFKVAIKAQKPQKQGNAFTVPIEVTFPAGLTLLPQENGLAGGFTFAVAVGNSLGGVSTIFKQPQSISIERAEEAGFRQTPITYTAALKVSHGENIISVGILDQIGRTAGFARMTIVAE